MPSRHRGCFRQHQGPATIRLRDQKLVQVVSRERRDSLSGLQVPPVQHFVREHSITTSRSTPLTQEIKTRKIFDMPICARCGKSFYEYRADPTQRPSGPGRISAGMGLPKCVCASPIARRLDQSASGAEDRGFAISLPGRFTARRTANFYRPASTGNGDLLLIAGLVVGAIVGAGLTIGLVFLL